MSTFLDGFLHADPSWVIVEDTQTPEKRKLFEALFTLSNGYLGMRGINEDMPLNTLPGTFIAGAFDKSECVAAEMVNFPNPVPFYMIIDGQKVDLDKAQIISHKRYLNLKNGTLFRDTAFRSNGKETRYRSVRFVYRHERNSAAMIAEITPLNWSGELKLISELDGGILSSFGSYFAEERIKHFSLLSINDNYDPDTVMVIRTRDVDVKYCFAAYLDIARPFGEVKRFKKIYGEKIVEEASLEVRAGQSLNIIKYMAVEDTRHVDEQELAKVTSNILNRSKITDIGTIWENNKRAWEEKWNIADIHVSAEENQDVLNAKIRFNLYHLLMNGSDSDYSHGIGIKGFTGEMYRGHYFWDTEMYMFPFYVCTNPVIARNLLVFRHWLLDSARRNAASRGFKGALYCWEDDERGNESINPEIIRETGELRVRETLDQYHKNLAVAYAVFNYYRATEDLEFMIHYGSDILVENMRFWESYLTWNEDKKGYESIKVMGPDEYHAHINNNYYTNYLFKAVGKLTLTFLDQCRSTYKNALYKITRRLSVSEKELTKWTEIVEKIYLPEAKDGVLEQYDGYFGLQDYTFAKRNEFGIPVIPELEELKNPSHLRYTPDLVAYHEDLVRMSKNMRIIKQADTVLLFNILPFNFSGETILNTLLFYEARTLHYSSLSPGVYALCAARVGEMELAERYFDISLNMDLKDVKHESENALHTPTSGEVYTIITQGYAGIFPDGDVLAVRPNLPEGWKQLEFQYIWRKAILSFRIDKARIQVTSRGQNQAVLSVYGEEKTLIPGQNLVIEYNRGNKSI